MIYDFDYAMKRWKEEDKNGENGILKYYYKIYKDMKPGTVENYSGRLNDLNYVHNVLKIVGAELPIGFEWSKVPEGETVCCKFDSKGDLSEYKIEVYYSEKLMDDEPDYMIVSSTGSLTPEQFSCIHSYLHIYGCIEATIFLGFSQETGVDCFDELSFLDFVRTMTVRI